MIQGTVGTLLLAAAAGYWVLLQAKSEKKNLKRAGQYIGWIIIVISLVGMTCKVWTVALCRTGLCPMKSCPTHPAPGDKMCPFTSKSSSPHQAPAQ